MRLKIRLNSERGFISLPVHHNKHIQAMLYGNMPKLFSKFLHDAGFFYEGKKFKLFTFSKIFSERFNLKNGRIYFKTPVDIYISSAVEDIVKSWESVLSGKEQVRLDRNRLYVEDIQHIPKPEFEERFVVRTLSPVTVYRTFFVPAGDGTEKKYTKYIHPQEEDFSTLVKENILKKFYIMTGKEAKNFEFQMKPLKIYREVPMKYMDTYIKAYEGEFEIILNKPEVFAKIYDAGLGSKNSQGFGMIEVV